MLFFIAPSSFHPVFFFFNDTATTEIYPLSLHDALPILPLSQQITKEAPTASHCLPRHPRQTAQAVRSEEHTSELQSPDHLVCRLLLEKKKKTTTTPPRQARCPAHTAATRSAVTGHTGRV